VVFEIAREAGGLAVVAGDKQRLNAKFAGRGVEFIAPIAGERLLGDDFKARVRWLASTTRSRSDIALNAGA
jgi:hypothetical protein